MELIFKNGNVTIDKHIPYVKENLGKILVSRDGGTEGLWALFSEADKKRYDDDTVYGETAIAVICNHAFIGIPWGAYVKVEFRGDSRPVVICEDAFVENHTFQFPDWASESICNHYLKGLQEDKYKLEDEGVRQFLAYHVQNAPETDVTAALKSLLEQ